LLVFLLVLWWIGDLGSMYHTSCQLCYPACVKNIGKRTVLFATVALMPIWEAILFAVLVHFPIKHTFHHFSGLLLYAVHTPLPPLSQRWLAIFNLKSFIFLFCIMFPCSSVYPMLTLPLSHTSWWWISESLKVLKLQVLACNFSSVTKLWSFIGALVLCST